MDELKSGQRDLKRFVIEARTCRVLPFLFQFHRTWQRQLDQQAVHTMIRVEFVDQVQ